MYHSFHPDSQPLTTRSRNRLDAFSKLQSSIVKATKDEKTKLKTRNQAQNQKTKNYKYLLDRKTKKKKIRNIVKTVNKIKWQ